MAWSTDPDRYRGVPKALARRVRARDHHRCRTCGAPGNQVDHIVNVKAGGTDDMNNLQVLCALHHDIKTRQESLVGRAKNSRYRQPERHPGLL